MKTVALALLWTSSATAAPKLCTNSTYLEQFERRGEEAIACSSDGSESRQCWRIDKHGQFAALPKADWPPPPPSKDGFPYATGDVVMPEAKEIDDIKVRVPDGIAVHVRGDAPAQKIDICTAPKTCRAIAVAGRGRTDDVAAVTVLPDKHTVFVGTGLAVVTAERLLRFDLDHLDAGRPIAKCAEVWDAFPGGNVLVQKSDCANAGGPRILFSSAGRILGEVGASFSMAKPEYQVGGDRWLFVDYQTFSVWDMRRGVELAHLPACPVQP